MEQPAKSQTTAARRAQIRKPKPVAKKAGGSNKRSAEGGPSIKMQIDLPGQTRLGPGKITLLEMIDAEGSLSKGARCMKISYRRAWLFVQQINQAFDEIAVATPEHGHGGGPARLTPFWLELIRRYCELERAVNRTSSETTAWLGRHAKKAP